MSKVHLDISQLVADPRRTGIQRVERELIRHWPERGELIPCRFDAVSETMRALDPQILDVLCSDSPERGIEEDRRRLQPFLEAGVGVPASGAHLLSAELFDDAARSAYYQRAGAQAFWLVYDFLPWLQPEWYPAGPAITLMPYIQALRCVSKLAFISAATKRDCQCRILRRPCDGPVIPLGGDGLGVPRQLFDPARRDIVMLGTLEPRKNTAAAMRAFRALWETGVEARLVVIGAVEKDAIEERALLRSLHAEARFVYHGSLPDTVIREILAGARALLFPSEAEGYGLPAIEALDAGIPVIVAEDLPALEGMPRSGQIRLPRVDARAIAEAVRSVLDDTVAARLWAEAAQFPSPRWRDFAAGIREWVLASSVPGPAPA